MLVTLRQVERLLAEPANLSGCSGPDRSMARSVYDDDIPMPPLASTRYDYRSGLPRTAKK